MPDKKSDKPEQSASEKELEQRVDLMMSTELPETKAAVSAPTVKKADAKKPNVDAPKNRKTAPKPPPKLPKNAKTDEAPEPEVPNSPPPENGSDSEDKTLPIEETQTEPTQTQTDDPLEDSGTNQAVDDIVASESDTILAVDDALNAREQRKASSGQPKGDHAKHKWLWIIGLVVLLGTAIDLLIFLSG